MGRKGVLPVPSQTAPVLYGDQQTGARGGPPNYKAPTSTLTMLVDPKYSRCPAHATVRPDF